MKVTWRPVRIEHQPKTKVPGAIATQTKGGGNSFAKGNIRAVGNRNRSLVRLRPEGHLIARSEPPSLGVVRKRGAHKDVQSTNLFRASKAKPIIKSNHQMYIVDSGVSLLRIRQSSLISQGRKSIRTTRRDLAIQTVVRVTTKAKGYIQELGTYWHGKLIEDSPSR